MLVLRFIKGIHNSVYQTWLTELLYLFENKVIIVTIIAFPELI
jgi:hypothetical protein